MDALLQRYNNAKSETMRLELCLQVMQQFRDIVRKKKNDSFVSSEINAPLVRFTVFAPLCPVRIDPGAMVLLARNDEDGSFIVVKSYTHESQPWRLPSYVLRQLYASSRIASSSIKTKQNSENDGKVNHSKNLQKCLDVHIQENVTYLIFKYYPILFENIFCQNRPAPGQFKIAKARDLVIAVHAMHQAGVVHRDIKDANICFDRRSRLVLIDFDRCAPDAPAVNDGSPVCTQQTRPPEQFRLNIARAAITTTTTNDTITFGMSDAQAVRACDWWSVGCVIAQMFLSGERVFPVHNESPSEFLSNIETFCREMETDPICSNIRHGSLKALRRACPVIVWVLLRGLLNMDVTRREPAALAFLTSTNPE